MLPDKARILHIRDEIDFICRTYSNLEYEDFAGNDVLKRAAQKSLEIIGEASGQTTAELKEKYPEIPWAVVTSLRNRLTHKYFDVSWPIVWGIIQKDIPALKQQIETIIAKENYF